MNEDNESSPLLPRTVSSPAPTTKTIGPPLYINPPAQQQPPPKQPSSSTPSTPSPPINRQKSWPIPAGLPPRTDNDENLIIFRRAIGINYALSAADINTVEQGRQQHQQHNKRQNAVGMYRSIISARRCKTWQYRAIRCLILSCHISQILIGASLTALGPLANDNQHGVIITILGALNTVIAGVLALVSGQGVSDRIQKDEIGYRKIQDWIEETEALLSVGVLGRDRKEVGLLVEEAFRKYNAAKANEEDNRVSEEDAHVHVHATAGAGNASAATR